jgi:DNA-binding CsgD family transcriptional regulator
VGLAAAAVELTGVVNALALQWLGGEPTPGFRRLGTGIEDIERNLAAVVEPMTRRSVWSLQPVITFDPRDLMRTTSARSQQRGLDMRMVTTERTLLHNPLLSSEHPGVHVGPVQFQCIFVDETTAVVAGPNDERGFQTAWLTTRTDVVSRVAAIWQETWARSRPALAPGSSPPFTPRQCVVARRLMVGTKDAAIARELGVSRRTIAADIAHLVHQLGASNRAAAVLALRGGMNVATPARSADAAPEPAPRSPGISGASHLESDREA